MLLLSETSKIFFFKKKEIHLKSMPVLLLWSFTFEVLSYGFLLRAKECEFALQDVNILNTLFFLIHQGRLEIKFKCLYICISVSYSNFKVCLSFLGRIYIFINKTVMGFHMWTWRDLSIYFSYAVLSAL